MSWCAFGLHSRTRNPIASLLVAECPLAPKLIQKDQRILELVDTTTDIVTFDEHCKLSFATSHYCAAGRRGCLTMSVSQDYEPDAVEAR
eukprot:5849928-Amphidinium_carterae.3